MSIRTLMVFSAFLGSGLSGFISAPQAAEPTGEALYKRLCASCHGLEGRGDGPASSALTPPPTDLTKLNEGVASLMTSIDGRRTIRAHGSAAMPVWGEVFEASLIGEPRQKRTALQQVQWIAEYVQSLHRAAKKTTP